MIWTHPSNRGRRLATGARAIGWQFHKHVIRTPKELSIFDGLTMRCYPDSDGPGIMIYSNGWPDYDDMHFVRRYLRPGDRAIDVGANVGVYTMLIASVVGKQGHVLSIEADPNSYRRLQEHLELNDLNQVEARQCAVGSVNGNVRFLVDRDLLGRIATSNEYNDSIEVPSVRLDAVIDQDLALGKMDIEGAEPQAFSGAQRSLADGNPPVWIIELKDRLLKRFDWSAERFANFFGDHGYQLGSYDADARELSFPEQPWRDSENVIIVKSTHIARVRERLAKE